MSWVAIIAFIASVGTWLMNRPTQDLRDDLARDLPEIEQNEQARSDERANNASQDNPTGEKK